MKPSLWIATACFLAARTAATEKLFDQDGTFQFQVRSQVVSGGFPDHEAADDFELVARIERVSIDEYLCFACQVPAITGVWLRFYEWTVLGPGVQQYERYFPVGDPGLFYDAFELAGIELTLPVPFQATGRHFVSVQVEIASDTNSFGIDSANNGTPNLSRVRWRDRAMGTPWTDYVDPSFGIAVADLAIELWGTDATPPFNGSDPCGTWEELAFPLPPQSNFAVVSDVEALSPTDVWASVRYSKWYSINQEKQVCAMAHFDGSAWSYVPTPNPEPYLNAGGTYLYDVEAAAPDDVWAAGSQRKPNLASGLNQQLFVLRWNGSQWTEVPTPITAQSGAWVNEIEVVAPDDVWFAGSFYGTSTNGITGQTALVMRWNGSSFTILPTPWPFNVGATGYQLYGLAVLSPTEAWAVGGNILQKPYVIRWDGSSWTFVDTGVTTAYNTMYDVVALASDDIWITGSTTPSYQALVLHGDGTSWNTSTGHGGGMDFHPYGPADLYLGGSTVSRWDGNAWSTAEAFSGIDGVSIAGLDASSACETIAVGRKYAGGMIVPFAARVEHARIEAYCSGDGTAGAACPCGAGLSGHGCPNSAFASGAVLSATGTPNLAADDVQLVASNLTGTSAVFFQGTAQVSVVVDDGLGCVGGTILRLGTKPIGANTASFPAAGDPTVSVRGQVPAVGATRHYQGFYRNAAPLFCPPATSNRTNGLTLVWAP